MSGSEQQDLYAVLKVSKTASSAEIKKAYHRAALTSHPDKVPVEQREEADIKFKTISQAYEILSDDDKRSAYDQYGMAAFEKGGAGGFGEDINMNDIFAQMFGGGMAGMGGMGGGPFGMGGGPPGKRRKRAKGEDEVQEYEVTLEELYKGKTTKFTSTKNVICSGCNGTGGRSEKIKPKTCDTCRGNGRITRMVQVGPGMVSPQAMLCTTCSGRGEFYAEKDKCKKCKGVRTIQQKKLLELYVPRGARQGEPVILQGEADQDPDVEKPGDIIFKLIEADHPVFERAGSDLRATLNITLAEALAGFNRVVLTHLDGRGISLNVEQPEGKVLRPQEILKVPGEGMPLKRSDAKGDLYLVVNIKFPEDGWLRDDAAVKKVRGVLPVSTPDPTLESAATVDEVSFEVAEDMSGFGAGSGDPRADEGWMDEDEGRGQTAECATQ